MPDLLPIISDLAWPFALAIAWVAGEFGHRWTGLPRINIYGLAGFLLANTQAGLLLRPYTYVSGPYPVNSHAFTEV